MPVRESLKRSLGAAVGGTDMTLETGPFSCETVGMTSTVTEGNKVAIPDSIAAELGITTGTRLEWELHNGATDMVVVKVAQNRAALAKSLFGAGKKFLKGGDDPIGDLVRARASEDAEREASL